MISIALPKGRLGEKVYRRLEKIGYGSEEYSSDSRKLIFFDRQGKIKYFWVKPTDVTVYVELGAADVGVVGKDIINENEPNVYELADLKIGKCKMCVAAKNDWQDDLTTPLRVATKFVHTAEKYFAEIGRDIEIIKLNGSIELAPVLGLSDVIVDIVETGTTLVENNLKVIKEIYPISARVIANKAAYKFEKTDIDEITTKLVEAVNPDD